jgi:hypothetical protein
MRPGHPAAREAFVQAFVKLDCSVMPRPVRARQPPRADEADPALPILPSRDDAVTRRWGPQTYNELLCVSVCGPAPPGGGCSCC